MPIYEYQCKHCSSNVELLVSVGSRDSQFCEVCGKPLDRLISVPQKPIINSGSDKKLQFSN